MKTLKIIGAIAVGMLGVFVMTTFANAQSVSSTATSTATSTDTTSSTPLTVGCSGDVSSNTITWSATASGGTAPYQFLWSGDPNIAGSTSTMVSSTYDTTGTINENIQATDAASNTALGNCSAMILAIAPTSTTPTSTVSSTPDAELQITNNVDQVTPQEGNTVTYTITVSALGPSTSTGVVATDTLPSGLTFANATATQGTFSSSTGSWTIGDLASGISATLTISATVNSGTSGQSITNTAAVGESPDVVNTNATTSSQSTITIAVPGGGTSTSTPTSTPSMPTSTTPTSTTPTSTTPLSVQCDWSMPQSNVITWNAFPTGGSPPYTLLWSGDQINGATGTSVTATYDSTGAVYANVTATDAASSTATAPCSATITSVSGGGGGTATSTPTTTPPVNVPNVLNIGANGSFLGRGLMVTSVASGSFQGEIWGITYTVNWNGNLPRFFFRDDNDGTSTNPSAQLSAGDVVAVAGSVSSSSPMVVTANAVRDYTITSTRFPRLFGNGLFDIRNLFER